MFNNATMDNLCRTCMCENEMSENYTSNILFPIFTVSQEFKNCYGVNICILDLLKHTIPQLTIASSDLLPQNLCKICLDKLIKIHEFQQQCHQVEQRLRVLIEDCSINTQNSLAEEKYNPLTYNGIEDTVIKIEIEDTFLINEIHENDDDSNTNEFITNIKKESIDITLESSEYNELAGKVTDDVCERLTTVKTDLQEVVEILKPTDVQSDDIKRDVMEQKSYACDECGKKVKTKSGLTQHKKIHLLPEKKHVCKYCQKIFTSAHSLKIHAHIHTGQHPYLCAECGKAFGSVHLLKQHSLRHTTDCLYECTHCPKKFRCPSSLAYHKLVHKNSRTHICDTCGAGFIRSNLLQRHKKRHTGEKNYKCDYCDMRFVLAFHCRRHMRTHTGEKPYKCKYCEQAFAQSNDLNKHLRKHLGDNIYKCELCPQGFRLLSELRLHFSTHKNDDDETRNRNLQARKDDIAITAEVIL